MIDSLLDPSDAWLGGPIVLGASLGRWAGLGVALVGGLLVGWAVGWPIRLVLHRVERRVPQIVWPEGFAAELTSPVRVLIAMLIARAAVDWLSFPEATGDVLRKICGVTITAAASLLGIRLLAGVRVYLRAVLTRQIMDASRVRSITTRVTVPIGILQFLVGLAGVALVCLQFQAVQHVGVSILASAGVAGVVLGLAAQRTVGNIFAGLQLAFAEPLRIGDTVVAEGEFGEVEEIGLTHVVLKVWDLHRLILPVSYFVEKPFQNWTKGSAEVIGTVLFYTDFTIPIGEVRAEFEKIIASTDLWDGKSKAFQVTNLTADKVELRALVSARDSGNLWELQCLIREQLLTWLQSRGQKYLPIRRVGTIVGSSDQDATSLGKNGIGVTGGLDDTNDAR
ncbi:Membrane protein [Fimbriiglobus ruber]|uniref:Membrane protein n=2 Tax=Fimbriiglobus ruber TaxID=1908690 RepID=A0A225DJB6_9BACT|nr:Membrane protein [Fimbriiglobus ruber]